MRAIYRHTIRFYEALEDVAVMEDGIRVFRGHPTTIVTEQLNLPQPYYMQMRSILILLDCVKQLRRGSARSVSEWILIRRPEEVDFEGIEPLPSHATGTDVFRLYQLATDASIETIEGRIGGLITEIEELRLRCEKLENLLAASAARREANNAV